MVKQCLRNLSCLYENCCKKSTELHLLYKLLKNIYDFLKERLKPAKFHGTRWISHLVLSMTGFIDYFRISNQRIESDISNTSKHCGKATLQGKRRQMVETEVLLKCIVFIVILDYTKNFFSLACQYKDIDIILLVERNR